MKEDLLEEAGLISVSVVTENETREVTEYFFLARLPLKLSLKSKFVIIKSSYFLFTIYLVSSWSDILSSSSS